MSRSANNLVNGVRVAASPTLVANVLPFCKAELRDASYQVTCCKVSGSWAEMSALSLTGMFTCLGIQQYLTVFG